MREYISHKDTTMGKQSCFRRTLCMLACFVKTVTSLTVQVAIGQQTTIPCSLAATLPAFTGPGGIAYTNEDDATLNPSLSASLKARLAIIDGNLVISNTESSDAGSYSCTYSGQGQDDNILEVGCEFLTAPSNGAADTLFGMPGDLVTFSCEDGYTLEGDSTLTCQANYTWNATVPVCKEPPCNLIVCWIIVIVYLVTCIILLVIYCVMQCEFDSDNSSLILKYILPACILTVIGIVVTVVVSRVAEKDCSIGACLVGPLIVSIIESWIPMIVICIHRKCCGNWKVTTGNNGGSSCFGGNNSILPICTGTDQGPQQSLGGVQGDGGWYPAKGQKNKQKPDHGRQKPDGDNGKHLDHGKQHLDYGKQRPLPLAGGDDGLQQNKTEKSGSVVSKGDVEIDEAPQFPRKLPEIPPGGEKNIRGISANFDEVVPDKKRLTPIGKETIEKYDEESPRKKKKKKKDKGKDTSVEYNTDL